MIEISEDDVLANQITAPHPWQIMIAPNPVWWKSFVIGLTAPLLNLPLMVFDLILLPFIRGIFAIVKFTMLCWIFGPLGKLVGLPFSKPKLIVSVGK